MQFIQVIGLLLVCVAGPLLERAMADPDLTFRVKWHMDHFRLKTRRALSDLDIAIQAVVGIHDAALYLRRQPKEKV